MAINTGYNPQNINQFEKSKLEFSGQALYIDATKNATTQADLLLSDDYLITGGQLIVQNGDIHDCVYLQVVHPIAGVVKEFVSGWRIKPDSSEQFNISLPFPAKIPAGLSLRCKYVASSAGSLDRDVAVNFTLFKVLE